MVDLFSQRDEDVFPDLYRVHVDFHAPALKKPLTEETVVDLGVYRNALHIMRRDQHDIHERLADLIKLLKRWTAPYGGLKTVSLDDIERQSAEFLARDEERERAEETGPGDSPAGAGGSGEAPEAHSPQ